MKTRIAFALLIFTLKISYAQVLREEMCGDNWGIMHETVTLDQINPANNKRAYLFDNTRPVTANPQTHPGRIYGGSCNALNTPPTVVATSTDTRYFLPGALESNDFTVGLKISSGGYLNETCSPYIYSCFNVVGAEVFYNDEYPNNTYNKLQNYPATVIQDGSYYTVNLKNLPYVKNRLYVVRFKGGNCSQTPIGGTYSSPSNNYAVWDTPIFHLDIDHNFYFKNIAIEERYPYQTQYSTRTEGLSTPINILDGKQYRLRFYNNTGQTGCSWNSLVVFWQEKATLTNYNIYFNHYASQTYDYHNTLTSNQYVIDLPVPNVNQLQLGEDMYVSLKIYERHQYDRFKYVGNPGLSGTDAIKTPAYQNGLSNTNGQFFITFRHPCNETQPEPSLFIDSTKTTFSIYNESTNVAKTAYDGSGLKYFLKETEVASNSYILEVFPKNSSNQTNTTYDIGDDYNITPIDSRLTLTKIARNKYRLVFNSNPDILYCPVNFTLKQDKYRNCKPGRGWQPKALNTPAIYIGGIDVAVNSKCGITVGPGGNFFNILKKQLDVTQTATGLEDAILKNFTYEFSSQKFVKVLPGTRLVGGAVLKINSTEGDDFSTDPDANYFHFSESIAYDEGRNPIAHSRIYTDNSGRTLQIQTKNFQSGHLLAAQTMYDQYDRTALQTMLAPIAKAASGEVDECGTSLRLGENLSFRYKYDFIRKDGVDINFTASSFDAADARSVVAADNTLAELKLKTDVPGTLGWYYSSNNSTNSISNLREPLVNKTDYPFSRVVYENDGSNDVRKVIPPGDAYRTAAANATTKAKYKNVGRSDETPLDLADEDEVINKYLFIRLTAFPQYGTTQNATYLRENISKVYSKDEHGMEAVSYVNTDGQTLVSIYNYQKFLIPGTTDEEKPIVAYNFYDDLGRLISNVSPNGTKKLRDVVINHKDTDTETLPSKITTTYASCDKTTFEYDFEGKLLSKTSADEGTTKYQYRNDGRLRFSQNAWQAAQTPKRFSYINYDEVYRPLEVGEYASSAITFGANTESLLETVGLSDGLVTNGIAAGTKSDVVRMYYDGSEDNATATEYPNKLIEKRDYLHGKLTSVAKPGISQRWFKFDERGRLKKLVTKTPVLGNKTLEYLYDKTGNVREVCYQRGQTDAFYHYYEFWGDGRLKDAYSSAEIAPLYKVPLLSATATYKSNTPVTDFEFDACTNKASLSKQASYEYYIHGPLKTCRIANDQLSTTYRYTTEGWLKELKTALNGTEVYNQIYDYYTGDYTKDSYSTAIPSATTHPDKFNGNIRSSVWKNQGTENAYVYDYDNRYQYTQASSATAAAGVLTLGANQNKEAINGYDANGNIKGMSRYKADGTLMHNLATYNYKPNTNQMTGIDGFSSQTYDAKGRVNKRTFTVGNITRYMTYNAANLLTGIYTDAAHTLKVVEYQYDESGNRISKTDPLGNMTLYSYDAAGNIIATYTKTPTTSVILQQIPVYAMGRIGTYNGKYDYEVTDHLGNVRQVWNQLDLGATTSAISKYNYYPYGLGWQDNVDTDNYPYGYQGQFSEKDKEATVTVSATDATPLSTQQSFDLRDYNAITGLWDVPDPYNQYYSSYIGMGNNPVNGVDPDGGKVKGGGSKTTKQTKAKNTGTNNYQANKGGPPKGGKNSTKNAVDPTIPNQGGGRSSAIPNQGGGRSYANTPAIKQSSTSKSGGVINISNNMGKKNGNVGGNSYSAHLGLSFPNFKTNLGSKYFAFKGLHYGVPEFESSLITEGAITPGPFVLYPTNGSNNKYYSTHEPGHVLQFIILGLWYYPIVAAPSIINTQLDWEFFDYTEKTANQLWYWFSGETDSSNPKYFE